ncbi:biotin synthase auxiliary protein BsaP [Gordonia sp. NPDC003504]
MRATTMSAAAAATDIPGPLDEPHRYGVYTGIELEIQAPDAVPTAARLGLEPPRFCGQCGRRMAVQVRPDGWDARCSRHGTVDSSELGRR